MNRKYFLPVVTAALSAALLTGCQSAAAPAASQAAQPQAESRSASDAAALIEDIPTVQAFTAETVAEDDLQAILMAGINAPSAMNGQPWHFTAITDSAVLQQIADDMGDGFGAPAGFNAPGKPADGLPEGAETPTMTEGAERPEKPEGAEAPAMPEGMSLPNMPAGEMPASPTAAGTAKAGIADAPLVIVVSCKEGSELDAGLAAQNISAEAQLLGYGTKIISSPKMALNGTKQAEYREKLGIPEEMSAVCMVLIGCTDTEQYDTVSGATARQSMEEVVTFVG